MRADDAAAKPWLPATGPQCPVSTSVQRWIETSLSWCADEFGRDTLLRAPVLPTAGFLPVGYTATAGQITDLVTSACGLMQIDPKRLRLDLFDGSAEKRKAEELKSAKGRAVGHFRMVKGVAVVGLDHSEASDPSHLTAIIAHELAHVRLLAEGRISARRPDNERLTDLLTVYFGFGVFSANAALSYARADRTWSVRPLGDLDERTLNAARNDGYHTLGYLSEREFGYALACYCWLRGEREPSWARYLDVGIQSHLGQGLTYLAAADPGPGLPTQQIRDKILLQGSTVVRVVTTPVQAWPPSPAYRPGLNQPRPGRAQGSKQQPRRGRPR